MLQVGDVAPDFELLDEEGKPTRLSSFRGRNVVILFFPAAFSPICTQELKQIAGRRNDYDREDAAVIGETGYAKRGTFIVDREGVLRGISVKEPKEARSEEDYLNLLRNCPR